MTSENVNTPDCKTDSIEVDLNRPYRIVVDPQDRGGPEKLRIKYFELPASPQQLGVNNVLIHIKQSGVNFADTYHRSGLYPEVTDIGLEGAGIVTLIGSQVTKYKIGDKVFWFAAAGSYATHIILPQDKLTLMKIPNPIAKRFPTQDKGVYRMAAAMGAQPLTAHYLCRSTFNVTPQTAVLIHAGAGGTGGLLVQMCKKALKSRLVIVTVGSKKKAKVAEEYGADHCILYKEEDFYQRVMSITKKQGVDVVFDGVGLTTWEKSLKCVARRGMCVYFGNASGAVPSIDPLLLCKLGSLFVTRPTLIHHIRNEQELQQRYADIFGWIDKGSLQITIGHEFALADAPAAHIAIESRNTIGKLLLSNGN